MNIAAMNILTHIIGDNMYTFLWSLCLVVEFLDNGVCSALVVTPIVSQGGCAILYSHCGMSGDQWMHVSVTSYSTQHLVLMVFSMLITLVVVYWFLIIG